VLYFEKLSFSYAFSNIISSAENTTGFTVAVVTITNAFPTSEIGTGL